MKAQTHQSGIFVLKFYYYWTIFKILGTSFCPFYLSSILPKIWDIKICVRTSRKGEYWINSLLLCFFAALFPDQWYGRLVGMYKRMSIRAIQYDWQSSCSCLVVRYVAYFEIQECNNMVFVIILIFLPSLIMSHNDLLHLDKTIILLVIVVLNI